MASESPARVGLKRLYAVLVVFTLFLSPYFFVFVFFLIPGHLATKRQPPC